jgi:phage tail-like protein
MTGETQDSVWPLPKYYFSVTFGDGISAPFQEVSGLDGETQVIEYRHGDSPIFSPIKMPGLGKVGNVTLRKGIFAQDSALWDWFNKIAMNTVERRTLVVNLLDENGAVKMAWALHNAFPTKLTGTDLKSDGNEVAVESIEIAFETMVISAP